MFRNPRPPRHVQPASLPGGFQYLIDLPPAYDAASGLEWPLVLFLHGVGERGYDPELVRKNGLPQMTGEGHSFPFILISPQCPPASWWELHVDALDELLDRVQAAYHVDPDRIYLSGISMGGHGAWELARRFPDRFAGVVPVCAPASDGDVSSLRDMPVWVFHGARDPIVPVEDSEKMVAALKAAGNASVKFTIYPETDHDAWTPAYQELELWEWLLAQRRSNRLG